MTLRPALCQKSPFRELSPGHRNCRRISRFRLLIAAALGLLLTGFPGNRLAAQSSIKSDERVLFFPTSASLSDDLSFWRIPVHGWIYEPEEDDVLRQAALGQILNVLDVDEDQAAKAILQKRAQLFLTDNESGKRIEIEIAGQKHTLPASIDDGHFQTTLTLSRERVAQHAKAGRLTFEAITDEDDKRTFRGVVHLVSPTGLSVISDIDDTIKISNVRDREELIRNTLLRRFTAVDGMVDVYRGWQQASAGPAQVTSFHFVSSSPWQLYEPLSAFTRRAGFPDATFHLKRFDVSRKGVIALFADPLVTKVPIIEHFLKATPERQFVLVGDSGEKDPEVYGVIARRHPQQVLRIFIRDVTGEAADSPRYRKAFKDVPEDRWRIFTDPGTLKLPAD